MDHLDNNAIRQLRRRLLKWYDTHQRQMPWRDSRDPYAIWVSEIMLQQTRVAAATDYFNRWMAAFPAVETLAAAPLDDALKLWEGLGYYSRCRNLHNAAKLVVSEFDGALPTTASSLLALPGIGRYTAAAIASIAFNRREAVLDGNVIRVLTRLCNDDRDPRASAVNNELWARAERLLSPTRPGDFNQAMMELGAMVCTPKSPRCVDDPKLCPLSKLCAGFAAGTAETLPKKAPKKKPPHYTIGAAVVMDSRGRVLIARRKEGGMLAGLWEFPGGKAESGESPADAAARETAEEVGLDIEIIEPIATVEHAFSHFRITLHTFLARKTSRRRAKAIDVAEVRWVPPADLASFAFPKANHATLRWIADQQ
ncbi:MAG: A/G-specific adenine glycosylase [Phycisphaerales bacterium]|jgi:A/G-specific adenine glycosylase|nr:A/G-specific adenine glycosylase [Phycisphaerales bacterium]MBT7171444.1 A/G-specific adenine glycosylase [Phycisphaerales bacterium]